jgi:ribosomal protein L32
MSIRESNSVKSLRRCLKCGKAMWTDRCHRVCPKCSHENEEVTDSRAGVTPDVRRFLRGLFADESIGTDGGLVGLPLGADE